MSQSKRGDDKNQGPSGGEAEARATFGAADAPTADDVLGAMDAMISERPDDVTGPQTRNDEDFAFSEEALSGGASPPGAPAPQPVSESRSQPQGMPLTPEKAVELLSRVNIFSALPLPFLKRLASICEEERHASGALVFKEGDAGDKLYLIFSGAVRISRTVPGMGEEALAVLKAGDYFGEMALIDDFPRSADALAHDDCHLVAIGKDKLQDLLFVDRDLAYDLLWTFVRTLSARLRQTNDKMTFMAVTSKF